MRRSAIAMTTLVLPAATTPTLRVSIAPRVVSTASTAPPTPRRIAVTSQFSMMSTPERVGGARIAPGDRVMPGDAAAPLQGGPDHRVAHARLDVERRAEGLRLLARQPFIVDAVEAVRVDMALQALLIMHVVREHHHAALREHDVVVERLRQPLPELHRMVVKRRALVEEVVRADDGGVAPGVAAADPALLQHRDIGDAEFLREIIGGGKPMAAAADDDRVVAGLRLGRTPLRPPALVAGEGVAKEGERGKSLHPLTDFQFE